MEQYIRTNDEDTKVLDYDLLDTGARANFLNDVQRMADEIKLDLDDPDFSVAEKNEALNDAATVAVNGLWLDDAEIEQDTHNWMVERIIRSLAERYDIELSDTI